MDLLVATSNLHKLQELRKILPESFTISGLQDLGFNTEIPETGNTFRENALLKARFLYEKLRQNCIADDSGLEVEALLGRPGVFSARYAGPGCTHAQNIEKLLTEMNGISNRDASFVTVLALILDGKEYIFEGTIKGSITEHPAGTDGFGYDPVFLPDGYQKTFAEMHPAEKNQISHRAIAALKLKEFLVGYKG